jgi:hypothetical protein
LTTLRKRRRPAVAAATALGALALILGPGAAGASAAEPTIVSSWASGVFSTSASLSAQINPNGSLTTYHFDYITQAAYEANLAAAKEPFTGAARVPASDVGIGGGTAAATVTRQASSLSPETTYRYRVVAKSSVTSTGPAKAFVTQSGGGGSALPDGRGWEMVSPVDKNGGAVAAPGAVADGGVLQASADGQSFTYGSTASFAGGQGAPPASQYLASRVPSAWATQNITTPIFSGTYDAGDSGVPYQLFSPDLARGALLNGDHCRGEGGNCAVANPPLAGTDGPAGYQNYYLREGGAFTALLGAANGGFLTLDPADFDLRLVGAAPDLRHGVLSSCAALSAGAAEVPLGEGCDPEKQNLYEYSPGAGLSLVNLLPAQGVGTPGAKLAAPSGAISSDGARVYWNDLATGDLYLRAGGQTKQVDAAAGGGGVFETASSDGSVAFFSAAGHLWRYLAATDTATDLTSAGGVKGVLGASADGAYLYYQDATGLQRWHSGVTSAVAPGAEAAEEGDWPAATGTARVSADGNQLLFVSRAQLSEYDNTDLNTGKPDSEVYLYTAPAGLTCVSCNPTLGRPIGSATIPGAIANGTAQGSTDSYKPRALSANGRRAFFDSRDSLTAADNNNAPDPYQWEATGEGGCTKAGGCISLLSTGRTAGGATFVDASADGADVFFLTAASLVEADPGAVDLYDARVGGGFPIPGEPLPCNGDACQPLPPPPVDPTLTTLLAGPGNPPVRYPNSRGKRCKKGLVKKKGKCVRKGAKANKKGSKR